MLSLFYLYAIKYILLPQNKLCMTKTTIPTVFTFFIVYIFLSCNPTPVKNENAELRGYLDSIMRAANGIIYENPIEARKMYYKLEAEEYDSLERCLHRISVVLTFYLTADYDSAKLYIDKTERYFSGRSDFNKKEHEVLSQINYLKASVPTIASHNDSIHGYLEKMLFHAEKSGNQVALLDSYSGLSNYYLNKGDYAEAISYYRKSLLLLDSLNIFPNLVYSINIGLGRAYTEMHNFEMAHYHYDQAFAGYEHLDFTDKFNYYNNRGNTYFHEENYTDALSHFKKAYSVVYHTPELLNEFNIVKGNLGEIYLNLNQLDSARYYIEDCYEYFRTTNYVSYVYHYQTLMLELALKSNNMVQAQQIMNTLISDEGIRPILITLRNRYLQHYYETVHDYKKAHQYLKNNVQLQDSINNTLVKMRVAETESRYKQDATLLKQTHLIEQQQSDMKSLQLRTYIWVLACFIIVLIAIFVYFYMRRQRAYMLEKHRSRITELRMENIRNRVSPHFIFNVLNRVISKYDENDQSYQELFNLIKLLRLNLKLTEKLNVTLEEELDFVNTYLLTEQQRWETPFDISIEVDTQIDPKEVQIPSMMIQIPVENAVKHGFRNKEGDKYIKISVTKENSDIMIKIEDNGNGFYVASQGKDTQSTGTGLKVLTQTIQLLNAYNKSPIDFKITSKDRSNRQEPGCMVTYVIPDNYSYNLG